MEFVIAGTAAAAAGAICNPLEVGSVNISKLPSCINVKQSLNLILKFYILGCKNPNAASRGAQSKRKLCSTLQVK